MRRSSAIPSSLLDAIYDSAADNTRWSGTLASIAECVGGDAGAVFCMDPSTDRVLFYQDRGLDETATRTYLENHQDNPWNSVMPKQPAGKLILSEEIIPLSALRKTGFYNEVLRPQGFAHNAMAVLVKRDTSHMAFNILRSEQKGPFRPHEVRKLQEILPHVHRSMTLGFRIQGYSAFQDSSFNLLDGLASAVILLDEARRPVFANAAALRLNDSIHLNGTRLLLRVPAYQQRLSDAITTVMAGKPMASLDLREQNGPLRFLLFSIRSNDTLLKERPGASRPAIAILILSQQPAKPYDYDNLRPYGFTVTEARVARAALETDKVGEIAARLAVSPNTIKTHLKRIYSKAGVSSRSQLMRALVVFEH